jgi:hypothetical protein
MLLAAVPVRVSVFGAMMVSVVPVRLIILACKEEFNETPLLLLIMSSPLIAGISSGPVTWGVEPL